VRVIGDEGQQLGIMPPYEALRQARELGLDLVEIAPTAQPPVCRIMDYGKYLYQQSKRAHEAKKHQRSIVVKEIKFRPNVDEHDYQTKRNHAIRFLNEGDKVKAMVQFRGREMSHQELGRSVLQRLIKELEAVGTVENRPRMEGNLFTAILAPNKKHSSGKAAHAQGARPVNPSAIQS
jgi:translation initiation factor IF-3